MQYISDNLLKCQRKQAFTYRVIILSCRTILYNRYAVLFFMRNSKKNTNQEKVVKRNIGVYMDNFMTGNQSLKKLLNCPSAKFFTHYLAKNKRLHGRRMNADEFCTIFPSRFRAGNVF